MALSCLLLIGGCSLVFDGGKYEGSGIDAGPGTMDAGADGGIDAGGTDAGTDAGGTDAGGRRVCTTHDDCLFSSSELDYVCVSDGAGGHVCADACAAPTDCQALGGGLGHVDGRLCLPSGDCGCETGEDCEDATYSACGRRDQLCEESNCRTNMDCIAVMPGTYCFGGLCQRVACATAADCTGEGAAACADPPGGMGPRVCSDECVNDTDCMTGQTCSATTRRCG